MKNAFNITKERLLTSFDINDILTNRSYIKFYAGQTGTSGNAIASYVFFSSSITMEWAGTSSPEHHYDKYDTTVKNPCVIEGLGIMSIPYGGKILGSGYSIQPTVNLKKISGGVTTTVCTVTFPARTNAGTLGMKKESMIFTIPKTAYKIGDTLRLEIDTLETSGGGGAVVGYGTDPKGRTPTVWTMLESTDTTIEFWLPFIAQL